MENFPFDIGKNSNKVISIIGSGLIGQAWAVVFLRNGFRVKIFDEDANTAVEAKSNIQQKLTELASFGLIAQDLIPKMDLNLTSHENIEAGLEDCCYIQECAPENLEIKSKLTAKLDEIATDGIPIGSSTSAIASSLYAADVKGRDRCLVVHPINPPHLIPAVEIVPSEWTTKTVIESVTVLMEATGQTPIVLKKEIEGFVVNRLQGALLSEAFRLLADDVVSYEDIDKAMTDGLGFRWSLMGPFESIHLNAPQGVAQYVERYGPAYSRMLSNSEIEHNWTMALEQGLEENLLKKHPISSLTKSFENRDKEMMQAIAQKKGLINR